MKTIEQTIKFQIIQVEDGFAYDVTLLSEEATLGQYIEGLDAFLDEKVAPCLGCDLCCKQRIPLTLPDIYNYAGKNKKDIAAFLKDNAELNFSGDVVDIKIKQRADGSCVFLDREHQRCLNHPHRGLVCHTYICLPQTPRAKKLRETLINAGEDALSGALFDMDIIEDAHRRKAYPVNPAWQGKGYDEIRLIEILPRSVWQELW